MEEELISTDWEPLYLVLDEASCRNFMYMATRRLKDGTEICLYKHSLNRLYLNIDQEGRFYEYKPASKDIESTYIEITGEKAFDKFAVDGWPLKKKI